MIKFKDTLLFILLMYMLIIVGCTAVFIFGKNNDLNLDHKIKQETKLNIDSNNIGIGLDSTRIK